MEYPNYVALLAVGTIASLIMIISLATPFWIVSENGHAGLWEVCQDGRSCVSLLATIQEIFAKMFMVIGTCFAVAATGCAFFYYFSKLIQSLPDRRMQTGVPAEHLVSGVLGIIAVLIYNAGYGGNDQGLSYGFSFYLAIVGSLLCLASGGIGLHHRQTHNPDAGSAGPA